MVCAFEIVDLFFALIEELVFECDVLLEFGDLCFVFLFLRGHLVLESLILCNNLGSLKPHFGLEAERMGGQRLVLLLQRQLGANLHGRVIFHCIDGSFLDPSLQMLSRGVAQLVKNRVASAIGVAQGCGVVVLVFGGAVA